jgi:hypothetical protein
MVDGKEKVFMIFTAHFYHKRKELGWTISTKAKSKGEAVAKLAPLIMQFDGWEMRHIKIKPCGCWWATEAQK